MQFRTIVPRETYPFDLDYLSKSFWVGSCFVTNMGKRMSDLRFPILVNPFGTSYNPQSIAESFHLVLNEHKFGEEDLFYHNGLWNNFHFHSSFSNLYKEKCLDDINHLIVNAHKHLLSSKYIFVTFGTAYVFKQKDNGSVVNNCHKLPSSYFERELLSVESIIELFNSLFRSFSEAEMNYKILFSVSPIRHLNDGAHGNQISKATLLLAVNELVKHFPFCFYFPSYEIMMDDLRDYRFYAEDMCHPSIVAENYIWDFFYDSFFTKNTKDILKEVVSINKSLQHRPINSDTDKHRIFVQKLNSKIEFLKQKYPYITF